MDGWRSDRDGKHRYELLFFAIKDEKLEADVVDNKALYFTENLLMTET